MKKAGIVGGLGPESTMDYYRLMIAGYQEKTGSREELPELLIHSINMYKVFRLLDASDFSGLIAYLTGAVRQLEEAGADFAAVASNTPHIVFDEIRQSVNIPMISIVEETRLMAEQLGLTRIGLLGTMTTMTRGFYERSFAECGITIAVPAPDEKAYIHRKIVEELEYGIVNPETKQAYIQIMKEMAGRELLEGMILGCTELPMILKKGDIGLPLLDTTEIHVQKIVGAMFEP